MKVFYLEIWLYLYYIQPGPLELLPYNSELSVQAGNLKPRIFFFKEKCGMHSLWWVRVLLGNQIFYLNMLNNSWTIIYAISPETYEGVLKYIIEMCIGIDGIWPHCWKIWKRMDRMAALNVYLRAWKLIPSTTENLLQLTIKGRSYQKMLCL